MDNIPSEHPRAKSLEMRHHIADGIAKKIVTLTGMIAHGRGEAFDYILGEKTIEPARVSMKAAVATLLTAEHPIISVNGNAAALVPKEIVKFAQTVNAKLEINIFYQEEGRLEAIEKTLRDAGATEILGLKDAKRETIPELKSNRRYVDPEGIFKADVVLVPLEDGDRTEALVKTGKTVITIDLNPLSRTAQKSHITIVDNLVRAIPEMTKIAEELKLTENQNSLLRLKESYDNKQILKDVLKAIIDYLGEKLANQ